MSGLEILGAPLGVLPVLISAAENYNKIYCLFERFHKFTTKIKQYLRVLNVQRTIFRNSCCLLLEHIAGYEDASEILKNSSHPLWQDSRMDCRFTMLLGDSATACLDCIGLIAGKLEDMEREGEEMGQVVKDEEQSGPVGHKTWRKRIGKKLKYTFSKSRLEQDMTELRNHSSDLEVLVDQLLKLDDSRTRTLQPISKGQSRDIEKFRLVQKASSLLYEALGAACTKHTEHAAHFCLEPVLYEVTCPQVRFNIAFRHVALAGSAIPGDPFWFAVESIIDQTVASNQGEVCSTLNELARSLKRREPSPSPPPSNKRRKKVVRFVSPSPPRSIMPPTPQVPNLCLNRNFCNQLKSCYHKHSSGQNSCIGLLDTTATSRHLIYLPSTTSGTSRNEATSLIGLFKLVSENKKMDGLPIYERLRLGRLLATAVLQFHATPWLKGSWGSEDVLFFGATSPSIGPEQLKTLTSPYMNVSVKGPNGPLSRASTFPSRALAPNPFLYGLGVMLLELAFQAPLKTLQKPADLRGQDENEYTDFLTARRLSHSASTEMGLNYNKVFKKCLQCDFGRDDDLNQPELQEAFYREVVCELRELEDLFKKIHLGPP